MTSIIKATQPVPDRICHVCTKTGNWQSCGKCRVVYYCSKKHQNEDFTEHKKVCELFQKEAVIWPVIFCYTENRKHLWNLFNMALLPAYLTTKLIKENAVAQVSALKRIRDVNDLKIRDPKDIVYMVKHRRLYHNLSNGIAGNEEMLKDLIRNHECEKPLAHIWGEEDPELRIRFLYDIAETFHHPLFMLELSRCLFKLKDPVCAHAYFRVACILFSPLINHSDWRVPVTSLIESYLLRGLPPETRELIRFAELMLISKTLQDLRGIISLRWLMHASATVFKGTLPDFAALEPKPEDLQRVLQITKERLADENYSATEAELTQRLHWLYILEEKYQEAKKNKAG